MVLRSIKRKMQTQSTKHQGHYYIAKKQTKKQVDGEFPSVLEGIQSLFPFVRATVSGVTSVGINLLRFLSPPSTSEPVTWAITLPDSLSRFPNTEPVWGVCGGVVNGILDEDDAVMLGMGATVGVKLSGPGARVDSVCMDEPDGVLVSRGSLLEGTGECGVLDVGPSLVLEVGTRLDREVAGRESVDSGGAGPE